MDTSDPLLSSADQLYCNRMHAIGSKDAARVQEKISYLYRNFDRESPDVDEALSCIRGVFYNISPSMKDAMRDLTGLTTTRIAFSIPVESGMPPSPEDTRIALIIGKPMAQQIEGSWKKVIEARYIVGLRVVNRGAIYLTKLLPAVSRMRMREAIGRPVHKETLEEGRLTQTQLACCIPAVDGLINTTVRHTKESIDALIESATTRFDNLLTNVTSALGCETASTQLTCDIQRTHSLAPRRCDTQYIEAACAGFKRSLGAVEETHLSPPKVSRTPAGMLHEASSPC